ncbi:metallophosphoesterase [Geomesophilobacter sediminis]|uniref:Metallophosphoesterase n=1 Tax=Geomesophilobacter sediminis TaxID=2798584 RepID=A0A8J7JEL5_9BACT|nr:metallophosphoesterase [Geomesophilobacter sediminis]MBJ6724539.1 metallophosphoesterase [Geomesophilobacter sediminis]
MKANRKLAAAVLAVAVLSAGSALAAEKWMLGDFHNHTTYTDGSWPMNDLTCSDATTGCIASTAVTDTTSLYKKGTGPSAFRNGLDFFTNSEHGGLRARDGFGNNWTTYSPNPALGDAAGGQMWRWQSLLKTSDLPGYTGPAYLGASDWLAGIRSAYPNKVVISGMEWNVPGHEHGSTGIASSNAKAIAEFEYRFDNADTDGTSTTTTATTMGWSGKAQNSAYNASAPDFSAVLGLNKLHNKTIDGVKWMQANYPATGYIIPAHVERAGCGVGGYSIAAFRDMNDNGPSVAFGFEGIPGHDKGPNRGEFGAGACGGGTYGGAGIYVAQVGGLWDNLLADGRRFFNFDNSDFHDDGTNAGIDFWPGEYEKTYTKVKTALPTSSTFTQEDVINGLRSGNSYSVHGDLINDLDYKVVFKTPFGNKSATMGETLPVKKGNRVTVQIRFRSPAASNCQPGVNASAGYVCQAPAVHHVQLIQGRINPTKAAKFLADGVTPNPAYNAIDPTVASVVATFDNDQNSANPKWTVDAQGYATMTYTADVQGDMFFRIRGTNLGYDVNVTRTVGSVSGTVYGTDAAGNPLKNTPGLNTADDAWNDLWFYSNPIFVNTTVPTQFVYTSDSHYGISRAATAPIANGAIAAQPVNKALVATINALPATALPCDGGVFACSTAVNSIDFVVNTGDIANRQETGIQSAATSWGQFYADYLQGLTVKDRNNVKAPLFLVPGNHDVSNAIGYYKAMSPAFDATSYVNIYNLMLGGSLTNADFIGATPNAATAAESYAAHRVYYSKEVGGVHFVFLGMWPDSAARTWMESDLAGVPANQPVVIFTHDQPDIETKHLMNPNGTHTINSTDKFENLVYGENGGYATAATSGGSSAPEQAALATWLKNHKNVVAYFHGNSNWNQFYTFAGPNNDVSLNVFRVDSPMKGEASATEPASSTNANYLSYQVVSVDPNATSMTVRQYFWNTKRWGAAKTVSLAPRTN